MEGFCTEEEFNNLDQDGRDMMLKGFHKKFQFNRIDGEFTHAFLDYTARHVTISRADDLRAMPEEIKETLKKNYHEACENQDMSFPVYVKATKEVEGIEKRVAPRFLRVVKMTKGWVCERDGNELEMMLPGMDDDAPIGTVRILTRNNEE